MTKDIEWLKKEIGAEMIQLEPNRAERWSDVKYQALRSVAQKLDQLDEPEVTLNRAFEKIAEAYPMTKEEVCRHLEKVIAYGGKVTYGEPEALSQEWIRNNQERKGVHFFVNVTKLQNLLVPKQESPVVPKFVADWITRYREKYDLYPALRLLENNTFVWGEIYEWYRMNTRKFVNAYLTGEYKVEEEPVYHALIKGHEVSNSYDIYWNYDKCDDDVFVSRLYPSHDNFLTEMSKLEWIKLGINDSNADFVRVDEELN